MAISVKNRKIFPPLVYCALLKRFPLELDIGAGDQNIRMMGLLCRERIVTISSAVWIKSTDMTDRRTDGRRATAKTALTHSVARQKRKELMLATANRSRVSICHTNFGQGRDVDENVKIFLPVI